MKNSKKLIIPFILFSAFLFVPGNSKADEVCWMRFDGEDCYQGSANCYMSCDEVKEHLRKWLEEELGQ